jgi:drug/metabolite transporter (DMT)-like permease
VAAVAFALVSALLFGAMTVALRFALRRSGDADVGAVATVLTGFGVALAATVLEAAFGRGVGAGALWPFALAGLLAPGGSQILFTRAVRDAGPSRASVAVGTAPLVSVTIALAVLHEPLRAPLVVGALLIVVGAVSLTSERGRPGHVRLIGLVYAAATTVLFATRDNIVRWLSHGDAPPPAAAASATLLVGVLVSLAYARRAPRRGELRAYAPAGLCFGLSYVLLFEAFYRGRVSVVAPLVATESL